MRSVRDTLHSLDRRTIRGARSLWINLPLLVLSIALATVLWAFVTNEQNPALHKDVPFQVSDFEPVNVPKSMLVTSIVPDAVTVTLSGPRDAVNSVHNEDIHLEPDLRGADQGNGDTPKSTYSAPIKIVLKKRGVRAQVEPQTVGVTLEPVVHRTVPVKVNLVDTVPFGFDLDSQPVADPTEATISGLKQNVDAVDAAYADLKLTGISVSTTISLPLRARSSDGRSISVEGIQPANASVKVAIKRTVFNREAFISVQTHGKPALGYQAIEAHTDPPSVTIAGTQDVLNSVTTIPTDDVEIEGATQDVRRVVALKPPPGVTIISARTVAATVTISPGKGSGAVLVAPQFIGPSNVNINPGTQGLIVSFSGPLPQVLAVKASDVTATVDIGGLAPGSYSREPKITLPPGLTLDSVQPPRVDFTIAPVPTATPTPPR